jgi:hypothetical protein
VVAVSFGVSCLAGRDRDCGLVHRAAGRDPPSVGLRKQEHDTMSASRTNPVAALDALIAVVLLSLHYWRRATAQRRWAVNGLVLSLVFDLFPRRLGLRDARW